MGLDRPKSPKAKKVGAVTPLAVAKPLVWRKGTRGFEYGEIEGA